MSGVGYRGEGCGDNRSINSLPKPESRPSAGRVPYRDKSAGVRGDGFQHPAIVLAQSTLCWGCSFRRETGKVGSVAPARRRGIRTPRRVGASPTDARFASHPEVWVPPAYRASGFLPPIRNGDRIRGGVGILLPHPATSFRQPTRRSTVKIKVTYDTNAKQATEIIAQAIESGAEWELCESDAKPTKVPTSQRKPKIGDRIVVTATLARYGVTRGDRGRILEVLSNGRKRQSYQIQWDDGTEGPIPGGRIRRTTK